ncbi:MAG: tRNA (adenosine(37)-N6)-dimethylallyltransferase MiaA, partial [Anaerolineae bacterium]|nr:tRNA (adenosine(37)-N6)-dimethylallyltransferase MiaA [Anaerolineae bacterium]
MIEQGLVEEVRALLAHGYTSDLPAMSGLGYRQMAAYLNGALTREEAIRQLKRDTRRFVHHQYTWFRLDDARIRWFDFSEPRDDQIRAQVAEFLSGRG